MHPFVAATAVRLHVTHGALTEMRLVTTVALKRRRNHTPSHANCLPDAYRVYYSLSLPRSASKPNSLAKPCWARVSFERTSATRLCGWRIVVLLRCNIALYLDTVPSRRGLAGNGRILA